MHNLVVCPLQMIYFLTNRVLHSGDDDEDKEE
jgi:hypothetical protein